MIFLQDFDIFEHFLVLLLHDQVDLAFEELDHSKRVPEFLFFYWFVLILLSSEPLI